MRLNELKYEPIPEERVLSVDPIARGYGFVVLEASPLVLVDWGVRICARKTAAHCELSLGSLIARYEPTALVIEDPGETRSLRRASLQSFMVGIADLLDPEGPPLYSYSRTNVQTVFGAEGAVTKYEIALLLTNRFPVLRTRLPKPKTPWQSEDSRMSIFDALSFAVTHLVAGRREQSAALQR